MAVCPLCNQRKGKRACPAKRAAICSACCGEKRIVEIACPADCVYLGAGVENDLRREALDYLHHQEPSKGMRWIRTVDRFGPVIEAIEQAIASTSVRSLEDRELLVALESARRTFGSEAKGVIYDDLPESPTLQAVTRELVAGVRSLLGLIDKERAKLGSRGASLPVFDPAAVAECLAVTGERCEYHIRRQAEAGSFVGYLRRVHPPRPGAEPASSSGIVRLS